MAGRRKEDKECVKCGIIIRGFKDYCTSCHKKILDEIKISRYTKRRVTPSPPQY